MVPYVISQHATLLEMTSQFVIFVSHRSHAPFQAIPLIVSVTHFTAVLHVGSWSPATIFWASVCGSKYDLDQLDPNSDLKL
jgi:hypothetical protein